MSANNLNNSVIFPIGEKFKSNNFNGTVWLNMLTPFGSALPIGNVTFEPGCRNSWHKHAGGQILLVTGGRGYYQEWGSRHRSFTQEMLSIFLPMLSTGMVLPRIVGLYTLPLRLIPKKVRQRGWNQYRTKLTIN